MDEKIIFSVVAGYIIAALVSNLSRLGYQAIANVTPSTSVAAPLGGVGVPTPTTTVAPTYTTTTPVTGGVSPYNLVTGGVLPTGGNYDQSRVTPCLTGDC